MSTSSLAAAQTELMSFDGGYRLTSALACPDRYRLLTSTSLVGPRISRGAGLSYCAASFGTGVLSLDHRQFNRVLGFDAENAVVHVEAGISLGELFDFLAPRGFLLRTQPGHPSITVGGCIAADVHGKNQYRDGNFSSQVEALTLFHPRHGTVGLSRDLNPDWFALTCGGYGLTGSILSASLRVVAIPGRSTRLNRTPLAGLAELCRQFESAATTSDIVYSWHDLSLSAKPFGRGVLVQGVFVPEEVRASRDTPKTPTGDSVRGLLRSERRGRGYPRLLNAATVSMLNSLLFTFKYSRSTQFVGLYESLFPVAGNASRYFDLFGRAGFHEYQALLPPDRFESFAREMEQQVRKRGVPVSLASAKFFRGHQSRLRFDGSGICFAVNVPRTTEARQFMENMDGIVLGHGGIPNVIKDSRLPADIARRAFAEFDRFRDDLLRLDPERLYRSELSERLGL